MIAKLAARGASFKGAGNNYLHDKDAQTSERVVWTETVNLWTANPERALRVMAGTAMDRDEIKDRLDRSDEKRAFENVKTIINNILKNSEITDYAIEDLEEIYFKRNESFSALVDGLVQFDLDRVHKCSNIETQ